MHQKQKHQNFATVLSPPATIIYKINDLYHSLVKRISPREDKTPINEFKTHLPFMFKVDNDFVYFLDNRGLKSITGIKIPLKSTTHYVVFQRKDKSLVTLEVPNYYYGHLRKIVELIITYQHIIQG